MSENRNSNVTYASAIKMALINDILDWLLFFMGVFIPFGDAIESPISLLIELLIIFRLINVAAAFKNGRIVMIIIIILESLDFIDILLGGGVDYIGWVEIIPFWTLFVWYNEENFPVVIPQENLNQFEQLNVLKMVQCSECGAENPVSARICESCGSKIAKTINN